MLLFASTSHLHALRQRVAIKDKLMQLPYRLTFLLSLGNAHLQL